MKNMQTGARSWTAALWTIPAVCMAVFLLQMWVLPGSQRALVDESRRLERETVLGLTGGLLESHPELEWEIAELLRDGLVEHQALGADILARYGYEAGRTAENSPSCVGLKQSRRAACTAAMAACCAVAAVVILSRITCREWMERMEEQLEACCSGRFDSRESPASRKNSPHVRVKEKLRRLEDRIRISQERLAEEKESTKSLVTDISHQLKTPIAALKTCFTLYLEAEEAGEHQEFLERSQHQMDRLEQLTGSLVNISRLETAMIHLYRESVALEEILIGAVNGVYHKAKVKDISLELEPGPDLTLSLDRNWTVEAVMNILDNAVKYSPDHTSILLTVEKLTSFVRVEIRDQGIGVPREERHRIFHRFYRGTAREIRAAEGQGWVSISPVLFWSSRREPSISVPLPTGAVFLYFSFLTLGAGCVLFMTVAGVLSGMNALNFARRAPCPKGTSIRAWTTDSATPPTRKTTWAPCNKAVCWTVRRSGR